MARRRNKSEERDIAVRRIDLLLVQARASALAGQAGRAKRHGGLVLALAQKHQTGLTPAHKARLCRKCGTPRISATSRVRLTGGRVTTTCLACGHLHRRPLPASASTATAA